MERLMVFYTVLSVLGNRILIVLKSVLKYSESYFYRTHIIVGKVLEYRTISLKPRPCESYILPPCSLFSLPVECIVAIAR